MNILLGVCGSVAAYKIPALIRLLHEAGHDVRCILTKNAAQFVGAVAIRALKDTRVYKESIFDEDPMAHIGLGKWADLYAIVPASANTIARLACGLADDLLSATALAFPTDKTIFFAPAMNTRMLLHPCTQSNIEALMTLGYQLLPAQSGDLACGETGDGRMMDIHAIAQVLTQASTPQTAGHLRVLISLGATREPIDAVRYISNASSGKMGLALAQAFVQRGACVTILRGYTDIPIPQQQMRVLFTPTAAAMFDQAKICAPQHDIFVSTAAVTDYKQAQPQEGKIKKNGQPFTLSLVENPDILREMSAFPHLFRVGFAAETHELLANARKKIQHKNVHVIIANAIDAQRGYPFGADTNEVFFVQNNAEPIHLGPAPKQAIAQALVENILKAYSAHRCVVEI